MRTRPVAVVLILALAASLSGCGSPTLSGGGFITVLGAWTPAGVKGRTTEAYMRITNGTFAVDTLIGATTTAAATASIRQSASDSAAAIASSPVVTIPIPAGQTVNLEPGGYLILLENLGADLAPGSTVQLTLTFEHAGPLNVQAEVRGGA